MQHIDLQIELSCDLYTQLNVLFTYLPKALKSELHVTLKIFKMRIIMDLNEKGRKSLFLWLPS